MINVANRINMMQQVTVDETAQLDISRCDFKDYNFGDVSYTYIHENEYARPDLIALRTLGTPNYWWFIMWFNGFSDPWHDLMPDTIIKVPAVEKVIEAIKLHKTYV